MFETNTYSGPVVAPYYIAHAAIAALAADGKMTGKDVARAIKQYRIEVGKVNPVGV